jgi:SAM-dependent methyltransferase
MQAEAIQRHYDEIIASNYDFDPQNVIGDSQRLALKQVRRHLQKGASRRGLRVLDLGVGTGRFLEELNEQVHIEPFGLDLSQKMIDIARKKIPELVATVDDAANLADHFRAVTFDLICTHFITGFVPMSVIASKIRARLDHGGYWSFMGGTKGGFPCLQRAASSKLVKNLVDGRALNVDDFVCNPADQAEVVQTFREHGFSVCECETFEPDLHFKDLEKFLEFAYLGGWLTPFIEKFGLHRAGKVTRDALNAWLFPLQDHHNIVIGLARKAERNGVREDGHANRDHR